MMKNALFLKCTLVFVLGVLLWVPLLMIENTIHERTTYREEAVQAIAASSAGEQKLWGPVLTITVDEEYDEPVSGWTKAGAVAGTTRAPRMPQGLRGAFAIYLLLVIDEWVRGAWRA